jgi:hypothetical protein
MFKLAEQRTYKWPVTVHIPADGGKFTKATFTAEFKALPQKEIDRVVEEGRGGDRDADLCTECLIGWSGVQDENGNDIPFSDEAKAKLLDITYVRHALLDAFLESITGGGARRKNSLMPRATG